MSRLLWHENELSDGRGLLQQLMRAASVRQRQTLRNDGVDLVRAEQLEQSQQVLAK
jgi:hypothetical protein